MKKLFLIDAYALIYRSYFAFINNPRVNSKGMNTSAVFGFVNTLEQILKLEQPTHLAVAFDLHGPTFRHELFDAYKRNEVEADNRYKGQYLAVTGTIDSINKGITGDPYLTLKTRNSFQTAHARLSSSEAGRAAALSPGQSVRVKCKGGGMTMGSPMLSNCLFD